MEFFMDIYERVKALCDKHGTTIKALEKTLGFGNATVKGWRNGNPSASKLSLVADYFGVTIDYLLGKVDESEAYYTDPEVAMLAQQLKDNPDLKILFDASKDLRKEDIEFVLNLIERMK
jgi:transcriptional regulator with XRE-family HTH domain